MLRLETAIDTRSAEFAGNRSAMLALLDGVRALERKVRDASESRRPMFAARNQMSPRERVEALFDGGGPFLELSTLAGLGMHDDDGVRNLSGGGVITGIGVIAGVCRAMVIASDSGIKGGTISPMGMRKQLRAQEIAAENKLPVVYLTESGGANLKYQAETFIDGGRLFRNQARLSAQGVPQINVVHGSSTAGGAYLPGLSDRVIMVKGRAKVFLAGPPLLKAATGEIADDESLGGADMHAAVSGLADHLAESDAEGLRMAREAVEALGWRLDPPSGGYAEPLYPIEDLLGIVPVDFRQPYDVREVIARIADGSELLDFKPLYGPATVCGQIRIEGTLCGLVGNNGPIDADGACKAAQFIQLMCAQGAPLVYLQNTTGFMVGVESERAGIVKHGSKMIQAVSNASVPQITLQIGAGFGAGNYGMCGRAFAPRFIFAWPNNRIAVMGGEQAAKVMTIVAEGKAQREGVEPDRGALDAAERETVAQFDRESTALFATARLWDDGIIDPRDTRRVLALCLAVCRDGDARRLRPSSFGVQRF